MKNSTVFARYNRIRMAGGVIRSVSKQSTYRYCFGRDRICEVRRWQWYLFLSFDEW